MLELARKTKETIVINDQIKVEVTEIKNTSVGLTVFAPPELIIIEEELQGQVPDYVPPERKDHLTPRLLEREKSQAFLIGNDIKVQVKKFSTGIARLGIEAPQNYEIVREEHYKGYDRHDTVLGAE